jgi:hypothetical protein
VDFKQKKKAKSEQEVTEKRIRSFSSNLMIAIESELKSKLKVDSKLKKKNSFE